MEVEDAPVGTRVRVQADYRKPPLQGLVGTIKQCLGIHDYAVFEVLFPDGGTELFWDHQLEEASLRPDIPGSHTGKTGPERRNPHSPGPIG